MSWNNTHFVFYCYCCKGQCPGVSNHLKCPEKSGNLIMTRVATLCRLFLLSFSVNPPCISDRRRHFSSVALYSRHLAHSLIVTSHSSYRFLHMYATASRWQTGVRLQATSVDCNANELLLVQLIDWLIDCSVTDEFWLLERMTVSTTDDEMNTTTQTCPSDSLLLLLLSRQLLLVQYYYCCDTDTLILVAVFLLNLLPWNRTRTNNFTW